VHPRFEGGQMPLIRRIPKRGFKNINRVEYQVVNVRELDRFEAEVSLVALKDAGLIRSLSKPVKILGVGEVGKVLSVSAHAFSRGAQTKIEGAGGSVSVISRESSEE
jgi:large subunit ribosomal protein L15